MSYLALYRKYRPQTFDMVIGQDHITTSLVNQIKNHAISHAYLFCGTRGTGKTSVAKIFAKAINCENPVNGSPCGKCSTCVALSNANNMDILEIDAASNNRVDEIRELREKVKYPPVNGKYKVYIVDEVHMLTDSAFNALLKTLEEPPAHVVFILATTEIQKLPATILSRCLRFDFKLVGVEDLEKLIKYVFEDSGIKYENEAVSEIARLGEGSVRDALSIADMCVAYSNKNVTYKSVLDSVGAIDKKVLQNLAQIILSGDVKSILSEIDGIVKVGKNITQIAKDLSNYFRDLAVVKTCHNANDILKYPNDVFKGLESLAKSIPMSQILLGLKAFSSLDNEFRYTNNPRLVLEVNAVSLCSEMQNAITLEKRIENLEKLIGADKKTMNINAGTSTISTTHFENFSGEQLNNDVKLNVMENLKKDSEVKVFNSGFENRAEIDKAMSGFDVKLDDKTLWGKILVELRMRNEVMLQALFSELHKYEVKADSLNIYVWQESQKNILERADHKEILQNILKELNPALQINVILISETTNSDGETNLNNLFDGELKIE